jgi:two-component system sensor histidine kinase KdpD
MCWKRWSTALARMEERLQGRQVAVELPADLPLVQLDAVMIEQVLVNLIENAVKYTPSGSPIEISAAQQNGVVRVEVADRGPGVAPGAEQRAFEKFYRGHDATIRGIGLGQAICRAILEAYGGKIWAWNRPQRGAVFRFTFPATERPPEVPEDA